MPLNELVLQRGDVCVPGTAYVALGVAPPDDLRSPVFAGAGVVIVAPFDDSIVSIGELMDLLGATQISTCDVYGRLGTFADSGLPIFEV